MRCLIQFFNQGLLGITIPAEAGGIGGTFLEEAIVEEEQSYAQAVSPNIIVHSAIVMPYFYNYGTPEQESNCFHLDAPTLLIATGHCNLANCITYLELSMPSSCRWHT